MPAAVAIASIDTSSYARAPKCSRPSASSCTRRSSLSRRTRGSALARSARGRGLRFATGRDLTIRQRV